MIGIFFLQLGYGRPQKRKSPSHEFFLVTQDILYDAVCTIFWEKDLGNTLSFHCEFWSRNNCKNSCSCKPLCGQWHRARKLINSMVPSKGQVYRIVAVICHDKANTTDELPSLQLIPITIITIFITAFKSPISRSYWSTPHEHFPASYQDEIQLVHLWCIICSEMHRSKTSTSKLNETKTTPCSQSRPHMKCTKTKLQMPEISTWATRSSSMTLECFFLCSSINQ